MLRLKNFFKNFQSFKEMAKNDKQLEEAFKSKFSFKTSFLIFAGTNIGAALFFLIKFNDSNPDISISRFISRKTGIIGEITIPKFLRKHVYEAYMKMYNVNKEEILDQNLENYTNIKEFFTRKIDVNLF